MALTGAATGASLAVSLSTPSSSAPATAAAACMALRDDMKRAVQDARIFARVSGVCLRPSFLSAIRLRTSGRFMAARVAAAMRARVSSECWRPLFQGTRPRLAAEILARAEAVCLRPDHAEAPPLPS